MMQHPTCINIRIRSTRDAHIIFHAVSLNILPIISRRLDAEERAALRSGCVYAWEERGPHTEVTGLGIERFTEGRRWGPSRVRDEFLFYYEKSPPSHLRDKENPMLEEPVRKHWDPLVKQTYSVWVDGPRGRRKWHLTAYFTQATVDSLQTVDDITDLLGLDVPPGKYISTRLGKPRRQEDPALAGPNSHTIDPSTHDVFRSANPSALRTYAPFPVVYQVTPPLPSSAPQQQAYDPNQQYYCLPPHPANGHAYTHHQDPNRIVHAAPESQRPYYDAPRMVRGSADYSPTTQSHGYYPPQGYEGTHSSFQYHYTPSPYTYAPPTNGRTNMQLPTPTSSSAQSSPVYSPHDYAEGSAFAGPHSASHDSPAASGSMPLPPQTYQVLLSSSADSKKRPEPLSIPSQTQDEQTSPESKFMSEVTASPRRPTLSLPPQLTSRLSPPVSDARYDYGEEDSPVPSPPHSPHSAVSSNSTPGGKQLNLAPLRTLVRAHPYKRDKFDDKALMAFSGRKVSD